MSLCLFTLLLACPSADDGHDDPVEAMTPQPPCARWNPAEVEALVQDEDLTEISGLVLSRANPGVAWVHEDSASGPLLTALGPSGDTVATLLLDGASAADWEDLALGACGDDRPSPAAGGPWCLVMADIGDNVNGRPWVTLLRVDEPSIDPAATEQVDLTAVAESFRGTYPQGSQNAEALVLEPDGTPVVITKRTDGVARLYRMPTVEAEPPRSATLIATTTIGSDGGLIDTVTGADLTLDGTRLLIRTYTDAYLYDLGADGLEGIEPSQQRALAVADEPQGEAIAWSRDERDILHVSEGSEPPLYRLTCRD